MQRNLGATLILTISIDRNRQASDVVLQRSTGHHLEQSPGSPLPQQHTGRFICKQKGVNRLSLRAQITPLIQSWLQSPGILALRQGHQRLSPPVQGGGSDLRHSQLGVNTRLTSALTHQTGPHIQHVTFTLQLRSSQPLLLESRIHNISLRILISGCQKPTLRLLLPQQGALI